MNYIIKDRKPENIFRFFEDICAIPHGSGNEKAIADYIEDFAKARGLEYSRDAVNNIFVKKPATPGRENDPKLMLQAHTDMVCEKNADTVHDFLRDPLDLYIEDGWLHARGTTLGADDGIGVAIMLGALDGAAKSHPALECLFTVSEETGMDGVINFDFSKVSAKRLINLDAAEIGTVIGGCAGGVRCNLTLEAKKEKNTKKEAATVKLCGLAGGHSGENINHGRANANKLMGRFLLALRQNGIDYRLAKISGGGKPNAIPRECTATIAADSFDAMKALAVKFEAEIKNELAKCDGAFSVECNKADAPDEVFGADATVRAATLLGTVANGVLKMSNKIEGLVEYSRNLGVIRTEGDEIVFTFMARSGINAQLDASNDELEALAALLGMSTEYNERYGGWDFASVSPLRDSYAEAYRETVGGEPKIESIHAGLECGFIIDNIPDMDIISVGPNEVDIHSPDERLELASVETLWKIVEKVMER